MKASAPGDAKAAPVVASPETTSVAQEKPKRVLSVDAFRGIVMSMMFGEVLEFSKLHAAFPTSAVAAFLAFNQEHVEWAGCSLHDLIQPGFSFLVGVSLPFSIMARKAKGQTFRGMFGHAAWRALLLIVLGIFLRSIHHKQTYFTFEDTLTQIGLGYVFLFALGWTRVRTQVIALLVILIGFWAVFALYPAPGPNFDYTQVGVPNNWPDHYTGFMSHWNKNSNASWAFDVWFLNLFPREEPFRFNGGGYATLSFIPTLGTMILGLLTGGWLKRSETPKRKLVGMMAAGAALMAIALCLHWAGVCPIVKRIWTPAWTLFSGGAVLIILSALYAVMEVKGWVRWAFPVMVVGMNSIAIYLMSWTMKPFVEGALVRHLGKGVFEIFGAGFEQLLLGAATLLVFWLVLYWMYRRKIFLRI